MLTAEQQPEEQSPNDSEATEAQSQANENPVHQADEADPEAGQAAQLPATEHDEVESSEVGQETTWTEFQDTFLLADAQCEKDSQEILQKTFLPFVNEKFGELARSTALTVYKRANVEESNKSTYYVKLEGDPIESPADTVHYGPIKMQCFACADIAQCMMNQGRETYASKWCPYCDVSHKNWQLKDHTKGRLWTIERIKEHVKTLHDRMTPDQQKGCNTTPLLDCVDIAALVPPELHILLGAGNGSNDNFMSELQASCELYSERYVKLETLQERLKHDMSLLADWKKDFNANKAKRMEELQKIKKRSESERAELAVLEKTIGNINKYLEADKKKLATVKKQLEAEAKLPENTKAKGQPVRGAFEDILKDHGIDKAAYFGGDLQGEACRRLMSHRRSIFKKAKELYMSLPQEQKLLDSEDVFKIIDAYDRLLGHFDALFSICNIKRFHLKPEQLLDAERHRDNIMELWRALGLSVTVKLHIIEDHICDYLRDLQGFGDLLENEGERGHQIGASNESRSKALRDWCEKAKSHARWEAMNKNEAVKKQISDVNSKAARKQRSRNSAEEQAKLKKMERDNQRQALLNLNPVSHKFNSLQSLRRNVLIKKGPVRKIHCKIFPSSSLLTFV